MSQYDWGTLIDEFKTQEGLSAYQFCEIKGLNNASFYRQCRERCVEVRQDIYQQATPCFEDDMDLIYGHLLGDGSLVYKCKTYRTPIFTLTSKHRDYAAWIIDNTPSLTGRPIWVRNKFDKRTQKTYTSYWFTSRATEILNQWRFVWYPDGKGSKKRIPNDLRLTPKSLLRWFMDDGSYHNGAVALATDGFEEVDVNTLKTKLENLGFVVTKHRNGNAHRLYLWRQSTELFFKLIGDCPVSCFQYKWSKRG